MSEAYAALEVRVINAIDALRHQENPNIAMTAREFAVSESRLRGRLKGQPSKMERKGTNKRLSEEQELAVCHYLNRLENVGAAARRPMLTNCANELLQRSHDNPDTPPPVVGRDWARRFIDRHPEYSIRKQKTLDIERRDAHDPSTIQRWFEEYFRIISNKGITATDTYNVDETGFRMGIGRNQWIITRDHSRQAYLASSVMNHTKPRY